LGSVSPNKQLGGKNIVPLVAQPPDEGHEGNESKKKTQPGQKKKTGPAAKEQKITQ